MADIQLKPLPNLPKQATTVQERTVARQQDWGITPAAVDGELAGLVKGLSEINPDLQTYTQSAVSSYAAEGIRRAEDLAKANAEVAEKSSMGAYDVAGQPLPSEVPPAFGEHYRRAFGDALADRVGAETVARLQQEYDDRRGKPGFDPAAFLSEARAAALGAFTSQPRMVARIGQHIGQFEGQVRASVEKDRVRQIQESRDAAIASSFAGRLREDMTPAELAGEYFSYLLPQAAELTYSKKDAVRFLLDRVVSISDRLGGTPEKFDVFDEKDDEGITLAARNPDLAAYIQREREQAHAKREKALLEASQRENFRVMQKLTEQAEKDPHSITGDLIESYMGPRAPFRTHDEALAFWQKAQAAAYKQDGVRALQVHYEAGSLHELPKDAQQDVLEANLGGHVKSLTEAVAAADVSRAATIGAALMTAQSRSGSSEPLQSLERFTRVLVSTIPNSEGPDARFQVAAALYQSTSAVPQFRGMYFKDDAAEVLKHYTRAVSAGIDPKAAYVEAYQAVSPEAKAAAAKFAQSPEFQKRLSEAAKHVEGASIWPTWMGGNGRPRNATAVQAVSQEAVRNFLQRKPMASDEEVAEHVKDWVGQNFVMDNTSGVAVRVPPQFAGPETQDAISEYTKRLAESRRLSDRNDSDWRVQLWPIAEEGQQGNYQVMLSSGLGAERVGVVSLADLVAARRDEKLLTEVDRKVLGEVQRQVRSGTVEPLYLQENRAVLAKARAVMRAEQRSRNGHMSNFGPVPLFTKLDQMLLSTMRQRLESVPRLALGSGSLDGLQFVPQRAAKVDNKLTGDVAIRFLTEPMTAPGMHYQSLAASLITLGEGTMLQAYPDPAKDAGKNIGMGYNLKANSGNAPFDLKRAGVPEDDVYAVLSGTKQLTPDQAMRLLKLSLGRYEQQVRDVAEKSAPGLWAKMTHPQRAVMIDIAYQTGNPAQFQKAWKAMSAGDMAAFNEAAKVHYRDKDGNIVEDKRRNALRAAMLQGIPNWEAVVQRYSGMPGSALESAKVGQ